MFTRILLVLSVPAWTTLADDGGARRCTNASLRGSYGFFAQGFTTTGSPVPAPLQGPFASLGTAVYDGRGGVELRASATFNGLSQELPAVKGAYDVSPGCTFVSKLNNGATFFASIVDDGQRLYVLQTTPGVIASGTAYMQSPFGRGDGDDDDKSAHSGACRIAITRGVYGFISQGTSAPPTVLSPAAGPLAGVGAVAFAPNGTFKLKAVRSANGIIDPQPLILTGSYFFTRECDFKMLFDGVGFDFNGTVVKAGKEVLFLETDPGTTFVVQATKM